MAANHEKNVQKFKELVALSSDDQLEFFLKSFIFDLGDDWKKVVELQKKFETYLRDLGESETELNALQAADFLQKNGLERTGLQRKEEVRDIDLDNNDRIAFVEYLLLHYKCMILTAYQKRTETTLDVDMSLNGVGITGVGKELLEELLTMPAGLPEELLNAIEEFTSKKKARDLKQKKLQEKADMGGVKGLAAKNELAQLASEDLTDMNRIELTLAAARRKAEKKPSGDEALRKKKEAEENAQKEKLQASRDRLKAKMAMFQNPGHRRRSSACAA